MSLVGDRGTGSQPAEECAEVGGEQGGLLEGGEVAALGELAPVHDGVVPLGKAAHGAGQIIGEHRHPILAATALLGGLVMATYVRSPPAPHHSGRPAITRASVQTGH